jgi:hypothetical protein
VPTLVDLEGFEHQVVVSNATTTMNPKLWDTAANTAQISFVTGRRSNGLAARISPNGAGTRLLRNYTTAGTLFVFSFYVRIITLPSSGNVVRVFHSTADLLAFIRINSDGTLSAGVGTGTARTYGTPINDGGWHRLDLRYNSSPATHTLDWYVDGNLQTQATGAGVAATNQTSWAVGTNQAETATFDVDDVVVSATTGDFPMGDHTVLSVVPNAEGTHNAGTNIMENAGTGNDINGTTETAWDKLDEWPPTTGINNADSITSSASGSANYAEVKFQSAPSWATSTLWAVNGIVAHQSDTTGANTGITRIVDSSGTTLSDIFSGDMSETSAHYTWKIITAPAGGWLIDATHFNGVKARVGFGTLQPGAPEWLALQLQAATPDQAPLVYTLSSTVANVSFNATSPTATKAMKAASTVANVTFAGGSHTMTVGRRLASAVANLAFNATSPTGAKAMKLVSAVANLAFNATSPTATKAMQLAETVANLAFNATSPAATKAMHLAETAANVSFNATSPATSAGLRLAETAANITFQGGDHSLTYTPAGGGNVDYTLGSTVANITFTGGTHTASKAMGLAETSANVAFLGGNHTLQGPANNFALAADIANFSLDGGNHSFLLTTGEAISGSFIMRPSPRMDLQRPPRPAKKVIIIEPVAYTLIAGAGRMQLKGGNHSLDYQGQDELLLLLS